MKRKSVPLYLWVTGAVTAASLAFSITFLSGSIFADAPAPAASRLQESFLLKDYHGKIALYAPGQKDPQKIYGIYLSTLPSYDRAQLSEGIPVSSPEELEQLLEDFGS